MANWTGWIPTAPCACCCWLWAGVLNVALFRLLLFLCIPCILCVSLSFDALIIVFTHAPFSPPLPFPTFFCLWGKKNCGICWEAAVKGAVWDRQCYRECCHTVPYNALKTAGFLFCLSKRSIWGQLGSSAFQFASFLMCCFAVIAVTVPRAVIPDKAGVELAQNKALQTQGARTSGSQHNLTLQLCSCCWAQSPHIDICWANCRHKVPQRRQSLCLFEKVVTKDAS